MFRFVPSDPFDPLDAAASASAKIFLWVGLGALVAFAVTRDWRALALASAAWSIWGIVSGLLASVFSPLATLLGNLLAGGSTGFGGPAAPVTIEEEMAVLERRLEQGPTAHQRILAGVRLAEIYRTHQRDDAKADALVARLCVQYPDAAELRFVRGA
jgi:hypothetical protein